MTVGPEQIRALTFDCYGTLIDWDAGIRASLEALPSLAGCDLDALTLAREQAEHELLEGPFRLYGELLGESLRRTAERAGRAPGEEELSAFAASMARWRPFPDAPEALRRLATRYRLAIVSNVETATLEESVASLGVPFAALVTAEEVRSYKPARAHFDEVLRRLELSRDEVLHVAGSLYHDVRPARRLGWNAVWINRRGEQIPEDLEPGRVFPDVLGLANALGL